MPNAAGGVTGVRIDAGIFTKLAGSTNDVIGSLTVSRSGNLRITTNQGIPNIENFASRLTAANLRAFEEGERLFGDDNERFAQHLLRHIGFDTGGTTGVLGVRTTSALIMVQWAAGIPITGEADERTLEVLTVYTLLGVARRDIMDIPWEPQPDAVVLANGFAQGSLVRIPNTRTATGDGWLQQNAAVAWAQLIQGVLDYNAGAGRSAPLSVDAFGMSGSAAGFRTFHMQVEAYADRRVLNPRSTAARPVFYNRERANSWLDTPANRATIDGSWRSIPEHLTQPGGELYGAGISPHGAHGAIDFNISNRSREHNWLRRSVEIPGNAEPIRNAERFGFNDTTSITHFHWNFIR